MGLTRYQEFRHQVLRQAYPSVAAPVFLREADSGYIPVPISERLVQAIWYDRRLRAADLQTTDGQPVRILFAGWWNLEAGPDFRSASIQIGNAPEQTGDIEVHLRGDDWFHHGHNNDPRYNNVILHVVLWEPGRRHVPVLANGRPIPQLVLQPFLDTPLEQLYDELDLDAYPHNVGNHAGPCAALLAQTPATVVHDLLDAAGDERFATKQRRYARWIHRQGAEQAFYEGWMEALGYKANKTAFRTLAQRLPLTALTAHHAPLLFGVAGFLPTEAVRARSAAGHQYVRRLWSTWWKLRPDYADRVLTPATWHLANIRPANHPHRRLGAAVALLKKHRDLLAKVTGALATGGDPARLFLEVRDDYWSQHFTLAGKAQSKAADLIGAARARDIVANVVLPFAVALAEHSNDPRLSQQVRDRYVALPAEESNTILRLAAHQLFGSVTTAKPFLTTARRQQGLMQVFHDFCVHDKSICRTCHFPDLVHVWAEEQARPASR
jgi:hypothetical protein